MARYEFKDIGEKIKKLRKENNMTQTELAERLKIQKSTICNWETGYNTPKPDALRELASIFGVSTDYLLNYSNNKEDNFLVNEEDVLDTYKAESSIHFSNEAITDENLDSISIKIKDDAINNLLKPGDSAVISKRAALSNGNLGAFLINKSTILIRKYNQQGNIIILSPDSNDSKYSPEIYDINKDDIKVIGKVVSGIINL